MNWILLYLLLQIINFSSAAPVDIVQTDPVDDLTTEANNLTKSWESVANITENPFYIKNSQELNEKLENSSLEGQKHLEKEKENISAVANLGNIKVRGEVSDNDVRNASTTTRNPTEGFFQEISNKSMANEFHSSDLTTETLISFPTTTAIVVEPEIENISVQNGQNDKDSTTSGTNDSTEILETTSVPTEDPTNFEAKETNDHDPTFKQAVDSFIADVLEIGDKLGLLPAKTESVTTPTFNETPKEEIRKRAELPIKEYITNNLKETVKNLSNQSHNFIENQNINLEERATSQQTSNSKHNASLENAQTSVEVPISETQEYDIKDTTISSSIQEVNESEMTSKLEFEAIANTSLSNEKQTTNESEALTSELPHESSNTTPDLKQPFDSFINQLSAIEDSIRKAVDEVNNNSSVKLPGIQISAVQSKNITNQTEPVPSFAQAIDSFIEDIVEIGDKLGLTVQSNTDQPIPASTELVTEETNEDQTTAKPIFEQTSDTVAESFDTISGNVQATTFENVIIEEKGNKSQTELPTTFSILENLSESLNNTSEKSLEYLFEEASNTFGKSVTELLSASAINSEATDEKPTELISEISSEEQVTEKLENYVSNALTLPFNQDAITETVHEYQLFNKTLDTTFNPKDITEIPQENIQTFEVTAETPTTESGVTEQSQTELNMQTATTEGEVEHAEFNHHFKNETNQSEIQTQGSKDNESTIKLNDIKQLDQTARKTYEQIPSEIVETESSKLNERLDESTETINESIINAYLIPELYQETFIASSTRPPLSENNLSTENNQLDISTSSTPKNFTFTTELTTLAPVIETTIKTLNFEEELQVAVETTHHQVEGIENKLKPFQKFTALETENNGQKQNATTTENPDEQTTSLINEIETRTASLSSEELHRGGIKDKFADNYAESVRASTENDFLQLQESALNFEESGKATVTITPPSNENLEHNVDVATTRNHITEFSITTTTAKILSEKNTREAEPTATKSMSETTTLPILARVSLQRNINSFTLNSAEPAVRVASTQETATRNPETNEMQQTHLELFSTTKNTESEEETTTLPFPQPSLKEMVTFTENTESTTEHTKIFEENNQELLGTTQTQEKQTLSTLMQAQQQYNETTTEHAAQIETTDSSEHTATTTIQEEQQTEQQTTEVEAEIDTTMMVEENETTVTPIEPEARSLSLTPPKLEYLQSDEGVEVFYGYSLVKHN